MEVLLHLLDKHREIRKRGMWHLFVTWKSPCILFALWKCCMQECGYVCMCDRYTLRFFICLCVYADMHAHTPT